MCSSFIAWVNAGDRFLLAVWSRVETALIRRCEYRHLRQLDDRLLKDIGLSRCDVVREAGKPVAYRDRKDRA